MQLHVFYLRDFVPKYVKHKGSSAFVIPILTSQSQHPMFNQYYPHSFDDASQNSFICNSIPRIGKPYLERTYTDLMSVCLSFCIKYYFYFNVAAAYQFIIIFLPVIR